MKLFRCPRTLAEVLSIKHLPLMGRLLHPNARRPLIAVSIGVVVMLVGSGIAAHRHELSELIPVNHLLFDTLGYFLHACGAVPALRYVEPLWVLLMGTAVE